MNVLVLIYQDNKEQVFLKLVERDVATMIFIAKKQNTILNFSLDSVVVIE